MGETGKNGSGGGGNELRELVHELNNRLFIVRMSAASLTETFGPEVSEAVRHRIVAIAAAAEDADALVQRLAEAISTRPMRSRVGDGPSGTEGR